MKNNLSKNLKQIRKDNNLSQEQFADLLGVSRQSVSKWETGDAYPEMEKIIFIADEFKLDINTLLTGEMLTPKEQSKAISKMFNNVSTFFASSFEFFLKMTFKTKVKVVLEFLFIGLLLTLFFYLVKEVLLFLVVAPLYNLLPYSIYKFILEGISNIYGLASAVLFVIIFIKIFENRYLKYFKLETEKIDILKENKIIIRDDKDSNYQLMNIFLKPFTDVFIILVKIFFFIMVGIVSIGILFLAVALALSFSFYKTGIFFIGLLLSLIGAILIGTIFLILFINFIFDKKSNIKKLLHAFISNVIVAGLGIGLIVLGILNFNIINDYDNSLNKIDTKTMKMDDDIKIRINRDFGNVEFIEEKIDYVKIDAYVNKHCSLSTGYDIEANLYLYSSCDNAFPILKDFFEELTNKNLIITDTNIRKVIVKANKKNLKILEKNYKENN